MQNQRVTIMGLGRHGGALGAARFAMDHGAQVTITDLAARDVLADSLAQLRLRSTDHLVLGRHRQQDFEHADLVVHSAAIRPDHPLLEVARQTGATVTTEIGLFLARCPATVVGVTGTNGKSTTCAMLAAIAQAGGRRVHLGGNLGGSLLTELSDIRPADLVVLELSSFQLWSLPKDVPMPAVAVVTNFSPHHLHWHTDLEEYRQAKQRLVQGLGAAGQLVLDDLSAAGLSGWERLTSGRLVPLVDESTLPELQVPGQHNRRNAVLASSAARAMGCLATAIDAGLSRFAGLPHRLEDLGQQFDRRFYNDSMATTTDSVLAALATVTGPLWLLAGGRDDGVSLERLAAAIALRCQGVGCFGASGPRLANMLAEQPSRPAFHLSETLDQAFHWCWQQSRPGDTILLSPGCSSLDQFADYVERATVFRHLVDTKTATGGRSRND